METWERPSPDRLNSMALSKASPELVRLYTENADEMNHIVEMLGRPAFDRWTREELVSLLGSVEQVNLLELAARMGDYGNSKEMQNTRRSVAAIVKQRGIPPSRGKRASPGLAEMVAGLTPWLLFFGLPLASSERSKVVRVLRLIAEFHGVNGDPRDQLRALIEKDRRRARAARASFFQAVADALKPSDRRD